MKILDKYILKKFITTYVFTMMLLIAIVVVINIVERNDYYIERQTPFIEIIKYYLDFMPYIGNLITPLVCFITTVLITSKLSTHTEIVAIVSSGISYTRLMVPFSIGTLIIMVLSFYTSGWIIPNSNKSRVAFEQKYFKSAKNYAEENIHIRINATDYIYIKRYNNSNNSGHTFTLEKIEDNTLIKKLEAPSIKWDSEKNKWLITEGIIRSFNDSREAFDIIQNIDTSLLILPEDFEEKYMEQEGLTNPELDHKIKTLKSKGIDNTAIFEIEKHLRFAAPFAIAILVFLGFSISSKKRRGGTGYNLVIGFMLAIIFVVLFLFVRGLAISKVVSPILAVWLPNITFFIVSFIMHKISLK